MTRHLEEMPLSTLQFAYDLKQAGYLQGVNLSNQAQVNEEVKKLVAME